MRRSIAIIRHRLESVRRLEFHSGAQGFANSQVDQFTAKSIIHAFRAIV